MTSLNSSLRVCSKPSHIDARIINGSLSWFGADKVLIYDTNPKSLHSNSDQSQRRWAYGISKDSG